MVRRRVLPASLLLVLVLTAATVALGFPNGIPIAEAPIQQNPDFVCVPAPAPIVGFVPKDQGMGAEIQVANSGFKQVSNYFVIQGQVGGVARMAYFKADVPGGTTDVIDITFAAQLDGGIIKVCANKPIGVVDGPEPIATGIQQQPIPQ